MKNHDQIHVLTNLVGHSFNGLVAPAEQPRVYMGVRVCGGVRKAGV